MIRGIIGYSKTLGQFNRNIRLFLLTVFLFNLGFAIFQTDFNLYILSMGMSPSFLGVVLSLAPFAAGMASIPIGFVAEKVGFKRSLATIYLVLGLSYFLQVISSSKSIIMIGSFTVGLVACGNFIIQLPFVSHHSPENQTHAFSVISITRITSFAVGSLLGGYLPKVLNSLTLDSTTSYRVPLIVASAIVIMASVPMHFLDDDKAPQSTRRISLSPYLRRMDANTARFASIELFVGLGMAFTVSFANVVFVYYHKSTLEFFGLVSALLVVPTIILLFLGPAIANRISGLRAVLVCRLLITLLALSVISTQNPNLGSIGYVLFRSIFNLAQSLWFAFVVSVATDRSRMATSAWLEITFQVGLGLAAIIGGGLINSGSFVTLGIASSIATGFSFLLTYLFFGREKSHRLATDTA